MKKYLMIFVIMTMSVLSLNAQTPPYQRYVFSAGTSAYIPVSSSATQATFTFTGIDWHNAHTEPIALPISFKYQNVPITHISIHSTGALILNTEDIGIEEILTYSMLGIKMEYYGGADGRGKVYYETIGAVGSRIFKVEFRNVLSILGSVNDTLNFQLLLHEGTNVIEYIAGYSNLPANFFRNAEDFDTEKDWLYSGLTTNEGDTLLSSEDEDLYFHTVYYDDGAYNDTLVKVTDMETESVLLSILPYVLLPDYPDAGTVFRFTPISSTGVQELVEKNHFLLYPNPSRDVLNLELIDIEFKQGNYTVYDIMGREMFTEKLIDANTQITIKSLPIGQYIIKIENETQIGFIKFIKK